jgi:hypothetical protein
MAVLPSIIPWSAPIDNAEIKYSYNDGFMTVVAPAQIAGNATACPARSRWFGARDVAVLPLLILSLLITYSGTLFLSYGYLDDYFWLDISAKRPVDVYTAQAVQGRPLNGYILPTVMRHFGGLASLWRIRALTIVEIAVLVWMFYLAARRAGWERPRAIPLAIMAGAAPAMQVFAAWATSVANPISGIVACGAAMIAAFAQDRPRSRWPLLPLSALMVLISATIYQPTAMVFWPIAALDLFRLNDCKRAFRRFAVYFVVAAVGLALAWGVFNYGLAHHPQRPSGQRAGITHDPIGKLSWFIHHPLIDSLNLFEILSPTPLVAAAIGLFLIIGLLRDLKGNPGQRLTLMLLIAALFPLSYLPNLLAEESWSSYRTQIGLFWLILILSAMALRGILHSRRLINLLMLGIAIAAAVAACGQVVGLIALPQAQELDALRTKLSDPDVDSAQLIFFLQPGGTSSWVKHARYDEFGRTSLEGFWVPQSAVNLVMQQIHPGAARIPVIIYPDYLGSWPLPLPPNTVLIDMRGAP